MIDHSIIIRRLSASVRVSGDPRALEWVTLKGQTYFEFVEPQEASRTWTIVAGLEYAPDLQWETHTRGAGVERVSYRFNREQQIVVIDAMPGAWRNLWTLRLVRDLLRWQLFHAGAVFVHGGLFEHEGRGFLLIGPSRAGKTTLLVRLMQISGNALIGEDDLTLVPTPEGQVRALGWPGSIRIRRDGLNLLPEIADLSSFSHPANEIDAIRDPKIGRLRIFHEELAKATGCTVLPETRLSAILAVGWGAEAEATQLDRTGIAAELMAFWDILPERRPGTRPKSGRRDLQYWRDFCFNPFLLESFGLPATTPPMKTPADFVDALAGYRIRHAGRCGPIQRLLNHVS